MGWVDQGLGLVHELNTTLDTLALHAILFPKSHEKFE